MLHTRRQELYKFVKVPVQRFFHSYSSFSDIMGVFDPYIQVKKDVKASLTQAPKDGGFETQRPVYRADGARECQLIIIRSDPWEIDPKPGEHQ